MRSRTLRVATAALLIASSSFGISACYSAEAGGMYVAFAPPVPPVEEVIVQPQPNFVWVPGYYSYANTHYVWVGGRWAAPPDGYHRWVEGHWRETKKGWHFEEGRWEK